MAAHWPSDTAPSFLYDSDASLTDSSDDDALLEASGARNGFFDYSASKEAAAPLPPKEIVTCMWDNCGRQFADLAPLITHVHEDHIGNHKSTYTCEWSTCPRRGLSQTSRFALVSHLRSHTGEKPFTCARPECDKSFTRSDALAKHMRLQHNIEPPLPGRGNRKRRRPSPEPAPVPDFYPYGPNALHGLETIAPDHYGHPPGPMMVKNEVTGEEELVEGGHPPGFDDPNRHPNGATPPPGAYPANYYDHHPPHMHPYGHPPEDEEEDPLRDLPTSLLKHFNPNKGTVLGRSVPKVKYLVAKAKHRYLLSEHELLLDELEMVKREEDRVRATKDAVLNRVLLRELGPEQSEALIGPLTSPLVETAPAEKNAKKGVKRKSNLLAR